MWKVYGEVFETADLASSNSLRVFSAITPNKNLNLLAVRCWYILYNDPTFTNLYMRIYSWNGTSPQKILATSTNTVSKTDLLPIAVTDNSGVRETYFEFNEFNMKSTDTYAFVTVATGYTGSSSSHIAWRKAWPDPVYPLTGIGSSLGHDDLFRSNYALYFIAAEL